MMNRLIASGFSSTRHSLATRIFLLGIKQQGHNIEDKGRLLSESLHPLKQTNDVCCGNSTANCVGHTLLLCSCEMNRQRNLELRSKLGFKLRTELSSRLHKLHAKPSDVLSPAAESSRILHCKSSSN